MNPEPLNTEDLIDRLAAGTRPIPERRSASRAALCGGLALVATAAVVLMTLGPRPDLASVVDEPAFLLRQVYALSIAGFAGWLMLRLGQPGAPVRGPVIGLGGVALLVIGLVAWEQAGLDATSRLGAVLGESWSQCSLRVGAISLAATPFVFFAARRLAPARPTLAGFAAGILAGAVAASAYGLYCGEITATFVAVWYSLGILTSGLMGAALGRWTLRW
jgi:hypothetical protein